MHNIAGNCNLQLSDRLEYLEGKRKERESGGGGKEIILYRYCDGLLVKIQCLQYLLKHSHGTAIILPGCVLNTVFSNSERTCCKIGLPITILEELNTTCVWVPAETRGVRLSGGAAQVIMLNNEGWEPVLYNLHSAFCNKRAPAHGNLSTMRYNVILKGLL